MFSCVTSVGSVKKRATSKVLNLDTQMQLFQFIALVGVKHQQFLLMEFHKDANN